MHCAAFFFLSRAKGSARGCFQRVAAKLKNTAEGTHRCRRRVLSYLVEKRVERHFCSCELQ